MDRNISSDYWNDLVSRLENSGIFSQPEIDAYNRFQEHERNPVQRQGPFFVMTDHGPEELTPGFTSFYNYKRYPDRVCYVPEHWDFEESMGYTARDILELCNGDQDLSDMIFGLCDWQHPSTVLGEWDQDDALALIERKQEKIHALEAEISNIQKQYELEPQPEAFSHMLPDKLIRHIQDQLKVIAQYQKDFQHHLSLPGTSYQFAAQMLAESRQKLREFCSGASFALPDEFILSYSPTENQVALMDGDYDKKLYIGEDLVLSAEEWEHVHDTLNQKISAANQKSKPAAHHNGREDALEL